MLICRVITGQTKAIPDDGSGRKIGLKSWPVKESGPQKGLIVDSLNGDKGKAYVLHHDFKAYPLFILSFEIKKWQDYGAQN